MSYFLLLFYLFLSFVRFTELFPDLAPLRIMLVLGSVTFLVSLFGLMAAKRKRPTLSSPQIPVMVVFFGVVLFSEVMRGWFGAIVIAFTDFGLTFIMFLVIVMNVITLRRLRLVAILLVLCSIYYVTVGSMGFYFGYEGSRYVMGRTGSQEERQQLEEESTTPYGGYASDTPTSGSRDAWRIRNLGFLSDPNDLAQVLLVCMALLFQSWKPRRLFRNLLVTGLPALYLVFGIYLTRSRGGLIGLSVLALLALRERLGRVRAAILTGLLAAGLMALNFTGGRAISSAEGSAGSRLDFWYQGILMLRSNPVFGVGYGAYTEHTRMAAHNSYVHCFAELGLLGYFVWLSLLVLAFLELRAVINASAQNPEHLQIQRWARTLRLSLATFLTAAFFLSRTYTLTLYVLLALTVAIADLARRQGMEFELPSPKRWIPQVLAWEMASIFFVWLNIKAKGVA
jgi:hypothetical protein